MKIYDFVKKYRGFIVRDPWGGYVGECVSLVKRWIWENHWLMLYGDAIEWRNKSNRWYKWYKNYIWSVPKAGDIIVFQTGKRGHIGIVLPGATMRRVPVFSQNWPHGKKTDPAIVYSFNYTRPKVLGWLRKR